ncbi:MAG: endo-1,4-beta-xylanase, partial [Tepidisphaeraceae bacterium]
QWQCVDLPVVAPRGYAADQWHFSIRLGFAQQRVQIGGVEVLNFGQSVSIDALPRIRSSYAGREAAASWREEALSRIEELRKGDFVVRLQDAAGKPIAGASIRVTLARHRFGFGSCVSMTLLQTGPDADRYRRELASLFSCAVVENELKWPAIRGHQYANSDALVDWLREAGLPTRGHVLLWPSPRYMPGDVIALASDKPRFARAIAEHITEAVSRYRGKLEDWDVINEPYAHHFAMDVLGEPAMVEWFQLAHAADPEAKLYINDYEILESGDELNTPHQNHFYSIARYLKDQGAPLHGVGIQGHFGSNITCPENVLKILDRFAALDVRIKITELDVQISDESLQADYFRDLLICLFSHPSVDAVMQWGFWEGSHWIPSTAMFRQDWSVRPHGQVFLDWVHGMWKTDVALQSDENGDVQFRGFFGDYMLQALVGGDTVQRRVSRSAAGHSATLTL